MGITLKLMNCSSPMMKIKRERMLIQQLESKGDIWHRTARVSIWILRWQTTDSNVDLLGHVDRTGSMHVFRINYYWLIMQTKDYGRPGSMMWENSIHRRVVYVRNSNMFRFFRMVARIVANGCTHVPDKKHQIASSSNGARREREARFECGSNSGLMMINTGNYQVILVG